MIRSGFNIPPSQFEAVFLSKEHNIDHIDKFVEAFEEFARKEV